MPENRTCFCDPDVFEDDDCKCLCEQYIECSEAINEQSSE